MALTAHPEVEAASSKVGKGGQVDLDAVGLGKRVQEDAFLNQVQVQQYSGQAWERVPGASFGCRAGDILVTLTSFALLCQSICFRICVAVQYVCVVVGVAAAAVVL